LCQIELYRDFREPSTARCSPLQQHSESRLNRIVSVTVDPKVLADVAAFTRPELFDESRSILIPVVEEGGADPIRKEDFGLLDPIHPAGEAEDLKGGTVRCKQIQSCI